MNGGFCHVPSGFCVHRQTAHCGRSSSGASAHGSFARSRCCVIGLLLLDMATLREMAGLEGLDFQARRSVPLLEPNFIVEIVGEARLLRQLRLTKLIKLLLR